MTGMEFNSWQDVQAEVLDRIRSHRWKAGEIIPNEADLAVEFGCARATVNRALRAVAETGLLERRRKAGTRVVVNPVRKATLSIPIIRQEIEEHHQSYSYALISSQSVKPPVDIAAKMQLSSTEEILHIRALHLADEKPYVFEDRWVNTATVPDILNVDLETQNANEWLIVHAPYTEGDIAFSALQAQGQMAELLGVSAGEALFFIERSTWDGDRSITSVRLTFHSGYRMHTNL